MSVFTLKGPESTTASLIRFGTVIDGTTYRVTLEWLRYQSFWIFSWADVQGRPIVAGLRVVPNHNLFQPYTDQRLPAGSVIAHDTQNKKEEPGRNDWRERHLLLFIPDTDVVEECPVSASVGS